MDAASQSMYVQGGLAVACVIVIDKWKLDARLPWLHEYTDQGNRIASVALAVLCTAAYHWRELNPPTQASLTIVAAWAAAQWVLQYTIYQVGWKPFLQGLLKSAGLGPTVATSTVEQHTVTIDPTTQERVTQDSVVHTVVTQATPEQIEPVAQPQPQPQPPANGEKKP